MNRFLKAQLAIFAPFMVRCEKNLHFSNLILVSFLFFIIFVGYKFSLNVSFVLKMFLLLEFCFFVVFEVYFFVNSKYIHLQQGNSSYFKPKNFIVLWYFSMLYIPGKTQEKIHEAHEPMFIFGFTLFFVLICFVEQMVFFWSMFAFLMYSSFAYMKFLACQLENGEILPDIVFSQKNRAISKFLFALMLIVFIKTFVSYMFFDDRTSQIFYDIKKVLLRLLLE